MLSNSISTLLLSAVEGGIVAVIAIVTAIAGIGLGVLAYYLVFVKKVKSAKAAADKIVEDGKAEAKTLRKEALQEAKEEQRRLRNEFERESKERRAEIQKSEQRLLQREDLLTKKELLIDKKMDSCDEYKKSLEAREKEIENLEVEISQSHSKMVEELEKVANMTVDEARTTLMDELLEGVKKEAGIMAKEIENNAKEEAEKKAKNMCCRPCPRAYCVSCFTAK